MYQTTQCAKLSKQSNPSHFLFQLPPTITQTNRHTQPTVVKALLRSLPVRVKPPNKVLLRALLNKRRLLQSRLETTSRTQMTSAFFKHKHRTKGTMKRKMRRMRESPARMTWTLQALMETRKRPPTAKVKRPQRLWTKKIQVCVICSWPPRFYQGVERICQDTKKKNSCVCL